MNEGLMISPDPAICKRQLLATDPAQQERDFEVVFKFTGHFKHGSSMDQPAPMAQDRI